MKPEQICRNLRIHNKTLADKIEKQDYFLDNEDIKGLAVWDRHMQLLVRCGNGRFVCSAQDVIHFCDIIDKSEVDYVRDMSLPIL